MINQIRHINARSEGKGELASVPTVCSPAPNPARGTEYEHTLGAGGSGSCTDIVLPVQEKASAYWWPGFSASFKLKQSKKVVAKDSNDMSKIKGAIKTEAYVVLGINFLKLDLLFKKLKSRPVYSGL